ncbi:MAG: hypothetical protein AUJ55_04020 [Proteobacteria bacterium CG1_02_64_396]|nr:MAG: hypothetical protein AUJ55_04020 [Proteobacteria bacterium CG1_02_64_396]
MWKRTRFWTMVGVAGLFVGVSGGACADTENGAMIFANICSSCHSIDKSNGIGPGLQGVISRAPSLEWIDKWLHDPDKVIESGDAYAKKLREGRIITMPTLKVMQDAANRQDVIEYLKTLK